MIVLVPFEFLSIYLTIFVMIRRDEPRALPSAGAVKLDSGAWKFQPMNGVCLSCSMQTSNGHKSKLYNLPLSMARREVNRMYIK